MPSLVTLVWTEASAADLAALEGAAIAHGFQVTHACRDALAGVVRAALARGAVIVAVSTDLEATQALGLGIDDVLRLGPVSSVAIDRAVARARARAEARTVRASLDATDHAPLVKHLLERFPRLRRLRDVMRRTKAKP